MHVDAYHRQQEKWKSEHHEYCEDVSSDTIDAPILLIGT